MMAVLTVASLVCGAALSAAETSPPPALRVPDGFRVTEFVSDQQAHDIYCLTFDSQGRLATSGPGYVRLIVDADGDGVGETVQQFADGPKSGAQGMHFHGRNLLCIGDGGLLHFKDQDGDDRADGPPDVLLKLQTGGEHDVHALQQGPDGWWYLIAGNTAKIGAAYASLPTSPVKLPRAGALLRFTPDLKQGEIVADGFRNAYDFAIHSSGDLFVYDSDDERDISLPWYRPTRVFQTLPSADHGWVSRSWKRPNYFCDMPPVLASFGRGSPTGMTCYRHTRFPSEYHNAVFALDWTYGRVLCLKLSPSGETWSARSEVFMSGLDGYGFAPTDCEVGPDGCLYVSVGGRGTRGAVYRVAASHPVPPQRLASDIERCLEAPQPLSSWSRARWMPLAQQLGRQPFLSAALDESSPTTRRVRAIEITAELFGGLDEASLKLLAKSAAHEVRARAVWSWGRTQRDNLEPSALVPFLSDLHPAVVRAALEAGFNLSPQRNWQPLIAPLAVVLGGEHRFNRRLAANLVARAPSAILPELSQACAKHGARAVLSYSGGWIAHPSASPGVIREALAPLAVSMVRGSYPPDLQLDALRMLQWMLGDLGPSDRHPPAFDGYAAGFDLQPIERELDGVRAPLSEVFPAGSPVVDLELSRVLAMLAPSNQKLLDKVLSQITPGSDADDDIHYLLVAARLPVPRSAAQRQTMAEALVGLDGKFLRQKLPQDSSWNDRMRELYARLCELDELLAPSLVDRAGFGRPAHVLFMAQMPADRLAAATAKFVEQSQQDPDYPWNNDVVFLLGASRDAGHRQLVRRLYERYNLRGAVLMTLSEAPEQVDRPWYRDGLESSQTEVVEACLDALEKLPTDSSAAEQVSLLRAIRRLGGDAREFALRERAVKLLERNTSHREPFQFGKAGHEPQTAAIAGWTQWVEQRWPQEFAAQVQTTADASQLKETLQQVDWSLGDVQRGEKLYQLRACAQCHGGRSALGPDLTGITGRFSREDLFTAIVDPNRDVSARYQTSIIQTKQGQAFSGLIVYEAVDGLLLRNASHQTFRIETADIEERRRSPVSLMPAGLLKGLQPGDYADLYAYLSTLK